MFSVSEAIEILKREAGVFVDRGRHDRHIARAFYGLCDHALMLCTGAGALSREYLCAHGNERAQERRVFIIDPLRVGRAEAALLLFFAELFGDIAYRSSFFYWRHTGDK